MLLGQPAYLEAKAEGENSMPVKRGTLEDVYGVAPQDPRDMAKAALLEAQSPAVKAPTRRHHARWRRQRIRGVYCEASSDLLTAGRWGMTPFKGTNRAAYVTLARSLAEETRDRLRGASPMATESP